MLGGLHAGASSAWAASTRSIAPYFPRSSRCSGCASSFGARRASYIVAGGAEYPGLTDYERLTMTRAILRTTINSPRDTKDIMTSVLEQHRLRPLDPEPKQVAASSR